MRMEDILNRYKVAFILVYDFIKEYLDERYDRIYDLPKYVGEVAGAYPDYILLITMKGHITCSMYGVIYDSFDCRDRTTEYCWIVRA